MLQLLGLTRSEGDCGQRGVPGAHCAPVTFKMRSLAVYSFAQGEETVWDGDGAVSCFVLCSPLLT